MVKKNLCFCNLNEMFFKGIPEIFAKYLFSTLNIMRVNEFCT